MTSTTDKARLETTAINEVERHVLTLLKKVSGQSGAYGCTLSDGKMADTAADLEKRGFVEQLFGYWHITDAGRSQLQSNRGVGS